MQLLFFWKKKTGKKKFPFPAFWSETEKYYSSLTRKEKNGKMLL